MQRRAVLKAGCAAALATAGASAAAKAYPAAPIRGMNALLGAPANGYTLLTDTPASAINPSLYKSHQSRYDAARDLAPVAQLMSLPLAIAVAPQVRARTIGELVALLKARPESLNGAAAGTSTRLAGELFCMQAGVKMTRVNYKGAMRR